MVAERAQEPLREALHAAGLLPELVTPTEARESVGAGTGAAVLLLPAREAVALCADLKLRHPAPPLPVLVVLPDDDARPAGALAPDAWLGPAAGTDEVVRRVRELLRLRQAERELVRLSATVADLTTENDRLYERARREAESTTRLMRELQHRVRNNLASIQALLVLERHRTPPRPLAEALDVAIARLRSMAALHDSQRAGSEAVDLAVLARSVARAALDVFGEAARPVLEVHGSASIPSRMGSAVALVLNELVTNAVKHAHAQHLAIALAADEREVRVQVHDDGNGLASDAVQGSGLRIVRAVVESELRGALDVRSQDGTHVDITLPISAGAS